MSGSVVLGVDVGGTNVKAGLVTEAGEICNQAVWSTAAHDGPEVFVSRLHDHAKRLLTDCGLSVGALVGIGIGLPAFLDRDAGHILEAINLNWQDVPIVSLVQAVFERPVVIDNDANLAALGEVWKGAGQGAKCAFCITLGTGIGGGFVLGGEVYRGVSNMAAEIGHLPLRQKGIRCNCGRVGCLETLASATAIAREGANAGLVPLDPSGFCKLSAKDVFTYAANGDARACRVIDDAIGWLATGLMTVAHVLNPDVLVVGGGLTAAGALLFTPLEREFRSRVLPRTGQVCLLRKAQLGNYAGVIGASRLAWQQFEAPNQRYPTW